MEHQTEAEHVEKEPEKPSAQNIAEETPEETNTPSTSSNNHSIPSTSSQSNSTPSTSDRPYSDDDFKRYKRSLVKLQYEWCVTQADFLQLRENLQQEHK